MRSIDRTWLLDVDNVIGSIRPRPRVLRTRVRALLEAAGPLHHAVAGYAVDDLDDDPVASVLAELGIAPLRVARRPDAAELALLAHARHVHAEGGRVFLVSSADRKFAELRALGRLELLVWNGLPVAGKLLDAAHQVQRLPRPTAGEPTEPIVVHDTPARPHAPRRPAHQHRPPPHFRRRLLERTSAAFITGVGLGLGHRLAEAALDVRRRGRS